MARQTQQLTYNAFTGGIITEASPITFPDGASLDENNFELTKQGYRKRRLGMDAISDSVPISSTATAPSDITTYRWDNSSTTGQEFLVVAVKNDLLIYDVTDTPPGDNVVYQTTISGAGQLSLTSHAGQLIIASGEQDITIIRSMGGDIFSERTERLRIRDREGIPAYKKDDSDNVKYALQSATNSGYRPTSAELYLNPRYDLPEDVNPPAPEPDPDDTGGNRGDNSGNDGPRGGRDDSGNPGSARSFRAITSSSNLSFTGINFKTRKLAVNNKTILDGGVLTRYELFTGKKNDSFMGVPIDSFYVERVVYSNKANKYDFGVIFRDGFYRSIIAADTVVGSLSLRNGVRYTASLTSSEYTAFSNLSKNLGLREFSTKHHPHIYNLWNQGWGEKRMESGNTTDLINPIDNFHLEAQKLPAAGDTVASALYANSSHDTNRTAPRFHPEDLLANPLGSTQAPAGRYVIDALDRGLGRRDAFLKDLKEKGSDRQTDYDMSFENTFKGATTVSSYAGRVWFAGFTQDSPGSTIPLSNKILYGQVSDDNILNCYQAADPTSPEDYQLVDTDGGYVSIDGIDEVQRLVATDTSLLVFASNGVWVIAGVDGNSFTPTSSMVTKITSKGAVNAQSVVQVDSDVFYWAEDGLYRLVSEGFAAFKLEAVSKPSINDLILELRKEDFVGMSGAYDARAEKLVWIIDGSQSDNERRELVLNLAFGSFTVNTYYKEDIAGVTKEVLAIIDTPQFINSVAVDNIVAGNDNVVADTDNVVVTLPAKTGNPARIAYIGVETASNGNASVFFANTVRLDFKDWGTIDAEAYLLTGYVSGGDTSREKQVPNLTLHFNRTETTATEEGVLGESGCLVQSQWEWTNDAFAGKWSNPFQGYRLPRPQIRGIDQPVAEGVQVVTTKNKLRGRGKTVSLKFSTEEGKDCQLLGWSMIAAANGNV